MGPEDPNQGWLQGVAFAAFAMLAGVLGRVVRDMNENHPVKFWPTCVQGLASGFVGLLVMWLCQIAGLSLQWTAVTVGVSGWLGAEASIQVIQRLVWKQLGLNRSRDNDNPPG
ncbi:LydA holin phage, holin superfamily III [Luteibacter sp. UNC138MFCol5.1]|uniref:phage holin family protein n=1 Tax=Luteibacter sp. UNC138MFCol5.1 TaxID=1502774 RepID=UPI0008B8D97C|nr:phage holin family protein [Luteibacter sp. UNC138MFCol5.1]SEO76576.1 LydA holin phage, holin superfamily III [Luteibacter sp. UNC138MFCol5.1]